MKKIIINFKNQLLSHETWRKVGYYLFTRYKDPKEGLKTITKEDIVPLIITVILGLAVPIIFFLILYSKLH